MNKLLCLCILLAGYLSGHAQSLKAGDVPSAVLSKFKYQYPSATNPKWESEDGMYEATFMNNKVETSVLYSIKGELAMTETVITDYTSLPAGILDYITKNVLNAKISEASKLVDAQDIVSYQVEINNTDYLFTANGQFLSKRVEEDDDND